MHGPRVGGRNRPRLDPYTLDTGTPPPPVPSFNPRPSRSTAHASSSATTLSLSYGSSSGKAGGPGGRRAPSEMPALDGLPQGYSLWMLKKPLGPRGAGRGGSGAEEEGRGKKGKGKGKKGGAGGAVVAGAAGVGGDGQAQAQVGSGVGAGVAAGPGGLGVSGDGEQAGVAGVAGVEGAAAVSASGGPTVPVRAGAAAPPVPHQPGQQFRSDVFLYGHPSGRRFRSAGEFAIHVMWLYLSAVEKSRHEAALRARLSLPPDAPIPDAETDKDPWQPDHAKCACVCCVPWVAEMERERGGGVSGGSGGLVGGDGARSRLGMQGRGRGFPKGVKVEGAGMVPVVVEAVGLGMGKRRGSKRVVIKERGVFEHRDVNEGDEKEQLYVASVHYLCILVGLDDTNAQFILKVYNLGTVRDHDKVLNSKTRRLAKVVHSENELSVEQRVAHQN
ncbi:hypothetical protein HDU93_001931 [Gonapodya sp. JEL0774]|nr:hypothetical protein HDU93_001931 [Gonapodya sp. JEL0774]